MANDICPWLGIETDPQVRYSEPSDSHVCHAQSAWADIELDYQTEFCLGPEHRSCRNYREPPEVPKASAPWVEAPEEDEIGPPPLTATWARLFLWLLAIVAMGAVVYFYVLAPAPEPAPLAGTLSPVPAVRSATATATATRPPAVSPEPTPAYGFAEPTATPTPYPGGAIYSLSPSAGVVGWVASDEARGNHMGDSYLYAGVFDTIVYHGVFQFGLQSIPRGATIHAGVLELTGLDARRLDGPGVWEVRVLSPEIDEDWSRVTYQDAHNAEVVWTLSPPVGSGDLAVDGTNVFELPGELLRHLEQRVLEEHYTVSFRLDGPLTGDNNVFAWDTGFGPATRDRGPRLLLNVGSPPLTPIPTGTPPFVVVTSTPTPANVLTAAAYAQTATAAVEAFGQPTATSVREWTATPVRIVTNTPTPAVQATADYWRAVATAIAFTTGTATPTPESLMTATSTPVWIPEEALTATPLPTPPPPTPVIPSALQGKILFQSDRAGKAGPWVMESNGTEVALLTAAWPYAVAASREAVSPDGTRLAFAGRTADRPAILIQEPGGGQPTPVAVFDTGQVTSPVWSPLGFRIVFVSTVSGTSQLWSVTTLGTELRQLTQDEWGSASHPSFSPDGGRLVYASRGDDGRRQIWSIGVDGSSRLNLSRNQHDEWDPIWVK